MKTNVFLSAIFIIAVLFGNANAQIQLSHNFNERIFVATGFGFEGYYGRTGSVINVYDEDFYLIRSVNIPSQGGLLGIIVSRNIFTTDGRLTFLIWSIGSQNPISYVLELFSENGNMLNDFGYTASSGYNIYSGPNGNYRLLVYRDNSKTDIYSLPGRKSNELVSILETNDVLRSDNLQGIRFADNIVSNKAEMTVIIPNNERVTETKIAIYDMTGNVVFETTARNGNVSWDLTNPAGRFVANGTYLVIAEVKGKNGRVYAYSSRLGVKR